MSPKTWSPSFGDLLPPLQRCDRISLGNGEALIHAPGFEDRTMMAAEAVKAVVGARAILLDYIPFSPRNRMDDVRNALVSRGVRIDDDAILAYDRFDPRDFESRLAATLTRFHTSSAVIDISTMSKLAIMLVLNVCRRLNVDVRVFYSEASEYGPSEEEFNAAKDANEIHRPSIQVFTGVYGVVRVDSLASVAMQGQPTAALVFMSFNDALTQVLLNTVYPSRLFLINGRPPVHSWREFATSWIHDQVRREWEEDNPAVHSAEGIPIPERVASTLDYRETVALLLSLYWQLSSTHRVLLAPAGSKMQAVGSFLVKALHPDIHVEYPSPAGFERVYSRGVGKHWLIDFGPLSDRIDGIARAERHDYLEIPS